MTTFRPYLKTSVDMESSQKAVRTVLWVLLVICMAILTRYILFKKPPHYYKDFFTGQHNVQVIEKGWKRANLEPFETIKLYYRRGVRSMDAFKNIGGNIIGFVPLGLLLPLLFPALRRWWRTTLAVFSISLIFETTQLITGWGMFDVDDMILNTTGGIIGFFIFLIGRIVFLPDKRSLAKS